MGVIGFEILMGTTAKIHIIEIKDRKCKALHSAQKSSLEQKLDILHYLEGH